MFKVFRRSPSAYHCFQEALHETVFQNRESPGMLIADESVDHSELRHGLMEAPHFQEVHDAWPVWKDAIDEAEIYGGYFRKASSPSGLELWRALMSVSRSRPVFQECRTSGRIDQIKQQLGGFHLYLWRNPWDQWLSQESMEYFGIVNRLLMNAPGAPAVLGRLLAEIPDVPTQVFSVKKAMEALYHHELDPRQRYRIFYCLWCLSLIEGIRVADIHLNIDSLSRSIHYRRSVGDQLAANGIDGLDFSDCKIPMGKSLEPDLLASFRDIERGVHGAIDADPELRPYLEALISLRKQHSPPRGSPESTLAIPGWALTGRQPLMERREAGVFRKLVPYYLNSLPRE